MIPIEVLKRVKVIYTHGGCPDGLASTMLLKDAYRMLGLSPRIEFLVHNTEKHVNAGYDVCGDPRCELSLFCDIAPHKNAASALRGHTIVLDHHKGSEGETERLVKSFGELGVFADEALDPGVSGAVLAFREVWWPAFESKSGALFRPLESVQPLEDAAPTAARIQDFAECCGVRDTWQTKDPRFLRGQWISKMLMAKPPEYWLGDDRAELIGPYLMEEEIDSGQALFEAHEEAVRQATDNCLFQYVGTPSPDGSDLDIQAGLYVFQDNGAGFRLTSDVAESMRQRWQKVYSSEGKEVAEILKMKELLVLMETDRPIVLAGFYYMKVENKPQLTYSLRTIRGKFDVAELAAFCGGGGHSKAAGFEVKPGQFGGDVLHAPYEHMRTMLTQFLAKKNAQATA